MAILERQLQKLMTGKWDELEEIDQEWTTIKDRHGYPPKTRYTYISGPHDQGTQVIGMTGLADRHLPDSLIDFTGIRIE